MSLRTAMQWALAITIVVVVAASARAEQNGEYETLLRQGVQLRREGKDVEALAAFRSAYKIRATPKAQAQMGLAEQALGHWPAADADLGAALEAKTDPWIAKNSESLAAALAKVRRHLGQLQVLGSPAGAKVTVDNLEIGELPMPKPARVPSGEVVLSVSAPGHISIARKIMVGSSQEIARETIVLHALEAMTTAAAATPLPGVSPAAPNGTASGAGARGAATASSAAVPAHDAYATPSSPPLSSPPPSAADPTGRPWQTTAGGIGLGLGALFLAGGITAHLLSDSDNQAFNRLTDAPNSSGRCYESPSDRGGEPCRQLWDSANLRLRLAITGYVASGLTLAGSLYLLLTAPPRAEGNRTIAGGCWPGGRSQALSCSLAFRF